MADTPARTIGTSLKCVIVTPEKALVDEPADFVAVPMFDGELGVLPGRQALIGRLGIGELRLVRGGVTKKFFIDGGFVQVKSDIVTVLTPSAQTAEDIKPDAVRHALEAEKGKLTRTPEEQEARAKAEERARAKLRIVKQTVAGGHGQA